MGLSKQMYWYCALFSMLEMHSRRSKGTGEGVVLDVVATKLSTVVAVILHCIGLKEQAITSTLEIKQRQVRLNNFKNR